MDNALVRRSRAHRAVATEISVGQVSITLLVVLSATSARTVVLGNVQISNVAAEFSVHPLVVAAYLVAYLAAPSAINV